MAWIEVHQNLLGHWKTERVASILGIDPQMTMSHLILFWQWALDSAETGEITHVEASVIAKAALFSGDPHKFVGALITAQFIDVQGQGDDRRTFIHDWWDYAGRLIRQRQYRRELNRQRRNKGGAEVVPPVVLAVPAEPTPNGSVSQQTIGHASLPTLPTNPTNRTGPNRTGPEYASLGSPASVVHSNGALKDEIAEDAPAGAEGEASPNESGGTDEERTRGQISRAIWASFVTRGLIEPQTRSERATWNVAIKEIVDAGGTPEEVHRRIDNYQMRYPTAQLTPRALAAHWGEMSIAPARARREVAPIDRMSPAEQDQHRRFWAEYDAKGETRDAAT